MAVSRPLGPPRDRVGRFVNWAGTVTTTPAAWHAPRDDDEVAALVRDAAARRRRLRVVGAGHSWSPIAAPDDGAVTLDRLAGVIAIDRARGRATVRGGTRLRDLCEALLDAGLALPIVGSIAHQSIAGAIATGTHGSSLVHGNLASLVDAMVLVTGRGERLVLGGDDPRLDGARVHLGALGVVTEVTLRVEPAFRLIETIEEVPVAQVAPALAAIARSAEYVKVWWVPHAARALVFRHARTTAPASRRVGIDRFVDEAIVHRWVLPAIGAIQRRRPAWVPAINRAIGRTLVRGPRVGECRLMLSTPMPARHRETEAALPLARAGEAFDRVVRLIERAHRDVDFIVEVRFVRGDDAWMSPAHGGDTCQLGAYMTDGPGCDGYFAAFWRELRALGARPHWGKELDHTAAEVRARFPLADRFLALRDELDPDRVFAGPFHARILGP